MEGCPLLSLIPGCWEQLRPGLPRWTWGPRGSEGMSGTRFYPRDMYLPGPSKKELMAPVVLLSFPSISAFPVLFHIFSTIISLTLGKYLSFTHPFTLPFISFVLYFMHSLNKYFLSICSKPGPLNRRVSSLAELMGHWMQGRKKAVYCREESSGGEDLGTRRKSGSLPQGGAFQTEC